MHRDDWPYLAQSGTTQRVWTPGLLSKTPSTADSESADLRGVGRRFGGGGKVNNS